MRAAAIAVLALTPVPVPHGVQASVTPLELERAVARLAERDLWPGFAPLAVPLAVYDGERTWLFRHPAPPAGFDPGEGVGPEVHVLAGRHAALTANSSALVGEVWTATVLLATPREERELDRLAALAVHETFHVHQRERHPDWTANEADLFLYPVEDAALLGQRRLETQALRRALDATDPDETACWAALAVRLRTERFASLSAAFVEYERKSELNEGLATYVERRAIQAPHAVRAEGYAAEDLRLRAYDTGDALARLLDRFAPRWRESLESGTVDARGAGSLDERLAAALAEREPCAFDEATLSAARARATTDVAALVERRAARLAAFESQPGPRLVIEVEDGAEPLGLQGFDPLNVLRIDERILHTRFLQLGNARGNVKLIAGEALTEGAGAHPLFGGVRRVELAGCGPIDVVEEGETLRVASDRLELELTGAELDRDGATWRIRLP